LAYNLVNIGQFLFSIGNGALKYLLQRIKEAGIAMHARTHLVEALRQKPEGREFGSRGCHWGREIALAHLVEALRQKAEGRGFDSRWCQRGTNLIVFLFSKQLRKSGERLKITEKPGL
jgi:hypothetical protein